MSYSPFEYLIGMLIVAAPMVACAQFFKRSPYRSTLSAVGLLFGLMVVDLLGILRDGDAYPTSATWVLMRTVFGAGLGLLGDYLFRSTRYHELAACVGVVVGIAAAFALSH